MRFSYKSHRGKTAAAAPVVETHRVDGGYLGGQRDGISYRGIDL